VEVSRKNSWNFYEVDKKDFESELHKSSITSNLSGNPNIIYIHGVETLKEKEFQKLIDYALKSPHRFILGARYLYKIPKLLRNKCHIIRVGEPTPDEFQEALRVLMSEPDRDKVREILAKESRQVELLLHILKNNVWKSQNSEVWNAVESCMNLLYKVSSDYQVSMLAYLFPPVRIPLTYDRKQKVNKEETNILLKLKRRLRLNQKEAVETFRTIKEIVGKDNRWGLVLSKDLGLSEEESDFLGIGKAMQSPPPELFVPQTSGLEKWM
jgi:hypothetical protein